MTDLALKRYSDEHAKLADEALKFARELEARDDEPTAEELAKLDAMNEATAAARKRRDQMAEVAREADEADRRDALLEEVRGTVDTGERQEYQLAPVARGEVPHARIDIAPAHEVRMAIKRGADAKEYMAEVRALSTGTDSTGGVLVPTHTAMSLYDYMHHTAGVMAAGAEVIMTGDGGPLTLPTVTAHVAVPNTRETAESAEITVTEDTFGEVALSAYNYTGRYDIPNQLLTDSVIAIDDAAARFLARHVTQKMETQFAVADGSSKPKGLIHSPAAGRTVTTNAATAIAYGELGETMAKVDAGYLTQLDGTCWMMHQRIYWERIKTIVDSDGRPHFDHPLMAAPMMIHGADVKYNNYMPGAFAANDILAVYGNIRDAYVVRMVGNIDVRLSDQRLIEKNQTMMVATVRADGQIRDDKAVAFLKRKA